MPSQNKLNGAGIVSSDCKKERKLDFLELLKERDKIILFEENQIQNLCAFTPKNSLTPPPQKKKKEYFLALRILHILRLRK